MLIRTVVAPLLATNCYVVADESGRCVVVDPGFGVTSEVLRVVTAERLEPIAVLATHGHVDHTWDAAGLCDSLGLPFRVHADDVHRVLDPFGTLGPLGAQLAQTAASLGQAYRVPSRVEGFSVGPDGALEPGPLAGPDGASFAIRAVHAPGHTEGSTLYLCTGKADGASGAPTVADTAAGADDLPTALTGDVLFAGTIGRTDLPGGDDAAMAATLRRVAALDRRTRVLPGHGPASTIGTEARVNPYLRGSG